MKLLFYNDVEVFVRGFRGEERILEIGKIRSMIEERRRIVHWRRPRERVGPTHQNFDRPSLVRTQAAVAKGDLLENVPG